MPADAPIGFVPTKWAGYLSAALESGDVTAYRPYADPGSFLLTEQAWAPQNVEFCQLIGKQAEGVDALAAADDGLHTALADFQERYSRAGGLLTRRLNTDLITSTWDDLLRVAASVQGGHATAALVVGKLCSSKRQQNALTSAIKEYGALRRTVYVLVTWNLALGVISFPGRRPDYGQRPSLVVVRPHPAVPKRGTGRLGDRAFLRRGAGGRLPGN